MGCDFLIHGVTISGSGFNSRTRMGCDTVKEGKIALCQVSIHAPAWGATRSVGPRFHCYRRFNSRTRMGCDAHRFPWLEVGCCVSIHAPAWGATGLLLAFPRPSGVSIHAPAWGATTIWSDTPATWRCFNSRHRMGCDALVHSCHTR